MCLAFPQIVLNGELVGGLDIFREMIESGEWDELYGGDEEDINVIEEKNGSTAVKA